MLQQQGPGYKNVFIRSNDLATPSNMHHSGENNSNV